MYKRGDIVYFYHSGDEFTIISFRIMEKDQPRNYMEQTYLCKREDIRFPEIHIPERFLFPSVRECQLDVIRKKLS